MIKIRTSILSLFASFVILAAACNDDEIAAPAIPSGCGSSSGIYATQVISTNFSCLPTNAFTDPNEALGPPDARATGNGKTQLSGIVSPGIQGSITLLMGSCVQDLPGNDIRVYQAVSREAVEVQISTNPDGPFISLGAVPCNDPPPFFDGFCEFDMAGSGIGQARFVRVIDRETLVFPDAACDNAGVSPGADIDAVENLHPVN